MAHRGSSRYDLECIERSKRAIKESFELLTATAHLVARAATVQNPPSMTTNRLMLPRFGPKNTASRVAVWALRIALSHPQLGPVSSPRISSIAH